MTNITLYYYIMQPSRPCNVAGVEVDVEVDVDVVIDVPKEDVNKVYITAIVIPDY